MKIAFLGSGQFAVYSLKAVLDAGYEVCCVVTQPDKPCGRGLHLEPTPVKALADKIGLKIYQPKDINAGSSVKFLKELKADLFIVVAYGQILSEEVINMPGALFINLHASLLPKYRGAAPINWAIINGEKTSGVTVIKVTRKMDAGPIIAQKEIRIKDSDTAEILEEGLAKIGAELLISAIRNIKKDKFELVDQNENEVSFAPKMKKEYGLIEWVKSAGQIYDLIKGVAGWPGAFTYHHGKMIKIFEARIQPASGTVFKVGAGEILSASKEGILVACGQDNLLIKQLQFEGKRRMPAGDFLSGHKLVVGDKFSKK